MSYTEYQDDLNVMLESTIFGLAAFSTAARLTRTEQLTEKWQLLADLESQALQRMREFLAERLLNAAVRPRLRLKGVATGSALVAMPWSMSMKVLNDGIVTYRPVYERLEQYAEGYDEAFFQYMLDLLDAVGNFALHDQEDNTESFTALKAMLEDSVVMD